MEDKELTREEFEKAYNILEKHFMNDVYNSKVIESYKLLKADYIRQLKKANNMEV